MKKYVAILKFQIRSEMNFKIEYWYNIFSFSVHMFVFNQLWNYILKDKTILGYTQPDIIWYVIVGEWIRYLGSNNYIKISNMIKNGDIANMLMKPIQFTCYAIAQEFSCVVYGGINMIAAIFIGLWMAGPITIGGIQFLVFLLSLLLSMIGIVLFQVMIGMLAFLTEENQSFYKVIQKAMLLLILTPLEFYPKVAQEVLKLLPTTYIIYPPGKILVHWESGSDGYLLIGQCFMVVLLLGMIYLISEKGVKNINVNGG